MATRKRLPQNRCGFSTTPGSGAGWTVTGATSVTQATPDVLAPDGTQTAVKFTESNAIEQHRFYFSGPYLDYRWPLNTSIFVRAGTREWFYFTVNDSAGSRGWFNATTGAIGFVDSGVEMRAVKAYQPDGTWLGWWRVSLTTSPSASIAKGIAQSTSWGLTSGDAVLTGTGDGTGTMYFWGPQSVLSDAMGDYAPTTTAGGVNPLVAPPRKRRGDNYFSNGVTLAGFTFANLTNAPVTAPDGTSTATTVTDSADGGPTSHYFYNGATGLSPSTFNVGTVWTMSVYARAGTKDKVALTPGGATWQVTFDLTNGVVGNTLNALPVIARCERTLDSDGVFRGWYRCSITFVPTTAAAITAMASDNRIWVVDSLASLTYTGAGTGTAHFWGAQMEQSDAPGDLVKTTSSGSASRAGLFGSPRRRTGQNGWSLSRTFNSWSKANVTTPVTDLLAPDGTLTAVRVLDDAVNTVHALSRALSLVPVAGKRYTMSCFFKYENHPLILLAGNGGDSTAFVYANVQTGTIAGVVGANVVSYGIVPVKDSTGAFTGWYRAWNTFVANVNAGTPVFYEAQSVGVISYAGTGTDTLLMWQAQHEQSDAPGDVVFTDSPLFQNIAAGAYNPSGAPMRKRTVA